jgi:hypothetical protein
MSREALSERLDQAISVDGKAKAWTAPVRRLVVEEVTGRFGELLDIRLSDILAGAWCKYRSLRKYADPQQYPPEESVVVPLADHDIESDHAPFIEVVINDTPVLKLTFSVDLALHVESAVLRIQNARIREIRPGEVNVTGTIAYGPAVIAERKSSTLTLPGSIDLGEGIAIRPPAPAAAGTH